MRAAAAMMDVTGARLAPEPAEGQVKSAGRVLDILEWFARARRPATIQALASALDLPHSSATALLNSLKRRGYLDHDPVARTFVPNAGLLALTGWLAADDTPMGRMLAAMASVRDAAQEGVLLASLDGDRVRYDQVLLSPAPLQMALEPGLRVPVHRTAAGIVLLGTMAPTRCLGTVARSVAADADGERFPVDVVLDAVAAARARGWHESRGSMSRGLSVVATLAGELPGLGPVAIGVGGPTERIADKRDAILVLLERATGHALARD